MNVYNVDHAPSGDIEIIKAEVDQLRSTLDVTKDALTAQQKDMEGKLQRAIVKGLEEQRHSTKEIWQV